MSKRLIDTIAKIVDRAEDINVMYCLPDIDRAELLHKLLSVRHLMDFDKLLTFEDSSFMHDINVVLRYVKCTTYEFSNCFYPRCGK